MNILTNSFVIHFYSRIWNEAFLGIENYESDHIYVKLFTFTWWVVHIFSCILNEASYSIEIQSLDNPLNYCLVYFTPQIMLFGSNYPLT